MSSSNISSPAVVDQKDLSFRWLTIRQATPFRIALTLAVGVLLLLSLNIDALGGGMVALWSLGAMALTYLLAEVMLVLAVIFTPLLVLLFFVADSIGRLF